MGAQQQTPGHPMANKFKQTHYVDTYELARSGMSDEQIAGALGVAGKTFRTWCARRPALADALQRGRQYRDSGNEQTFYDYIYNHLSPELRLLWSEINECEQLDSPYERVEALLAGHGKRARQHLFLYALTQSMFNVSQSLRRLCIPRKTYETWKANDPEFTELMDEIHWHKQNFFEQAFIARVAAGDTAATIHAAKTVLRDRGYNEKIEVEHTGNITTTEVVVNVAELELDLDTRRTLLQALQRRLPVVGGAGA